MVLLEDSGALIGLLFAFAGVGLTMLTGDPIWDGVGTVAIGGLLGAIAIVLIVDRGGERSPRRRGTRSDRSGRLIPSSAASSLGQRC